LSHRLRLGFLLLRGNILDVPATKYLLEDHGLGRRFGVINCFEPILRDRPLAIDVAVVNDREAALLGTLVADVRAVPDLDDGVGAAFVFKGSGI
jgi:hypothetical protein